MTAAVLAMGVPSEVPAKAAFFGAGKGGYGEGDQFLGVRVPELRQLARRYRACASLADVHTLLGSPWHEVRLLGAILLVELYKAGNANVRRESVELLLRSTDRLNNWDLVDSSAPYTLGHWLVGHPDQRHLLDGLAASTSLWERRISIVATLGLIREGEFDDTIRMAETLLGDPHDLIHKATGWMLREVGARNRQKLDSFLDRHGSRMPRTMLRYAIEKHSPEERRALLESTSS
jgi:3-methyladenine DNA glycosylase AlkD